MTAKPAPKIAPKTTPKRAATKPPKKRVVPEVVKTPPTSGPSWEALGEFIRTQRRLANLSLRQLAERARVSNPYLSQIERGLHKPSAQVIKGLADALHISAQTLYERVGLLDAGERPEAMSVEDAIRLDTRLAADQQDALIRVYRGFVNH